MLVIITFPTNVKIPRALDTSAVGIILVPGPNCYDDWERGVTLLAYLLPRVHSQHSQNIFRANLVVAEDTAEII